MGIHDETMRYVIGDVHGRTFWKSYLNIQFTKLYFIGDYFDSNVIPFSKQYNNFSAICKAARRNSRIKLCLGNHDYQYLRGVHGQCYSGFQADHSEEISDILEENIDLFKIVYVTDDHYIISHAGVTECFLKSLGVSKPEEINAAFLEDRNVLNFNGINIFGDDITQGPLWVRPPSLKQNPLPGYNQIVGHTPVDEITKTKLDGADILVLIDTCDSNAVYRF